MEFINILQKDGREITEEIVIEFLRNKMGITSISKEDISVAHRTLLPKNAARSKGVDPNIAPIYVKFISRKAKNFVLRKRRVLRGQFNENGDRYFIFENLTEFRRTLFHEVKASLKTWRYIYTKEGNIMAKKYQNSRPVKINTYEDLDIILYENLQFIENRCE